LNIEERGEWSLVLRRGRGMGVVDSGSGDPHRGYGLGYSEILWDRWCWGED